MSQLAKALFELLRLSEGGAGTLTSYLLSEVAGELISEGVAYQLPESNHERFKIRA
jgi:hypothetical protein